MSRKPRPPARSAGAALDLDRLRDAVAALMDEAMGFVSLSRITEQARSWMARGSQDDPLPGSSFLDGDDAMDFATDLALFTPTARGQTAFDRLTNKRTLLGKAEQAALALIRAAHPRLLRIEATGRGTATLADLLSSDTVQLVDEAMAPGLVGTVILARLAPIGDGRSLLIGPVTPLDPSGQAAALALAKPGFPLTLRALEVLYRHVIRQGTPLIAGLNDADPEEEEPDDDEAVG